VCVCVCVCCVGVGVCVWCVCGVCVYVSVCVWCFFLNTFIYQHAPLLMSNTCNVLNFTYYDLSCLYTFYNIY